jgi:hypothetical protein
MHRYLIVLILLCLLGPLASADFFVSPSGDDRWTGIDPEPASNGKDGPFATIERAQMAVREHLRQYPGKDVTVWLRGGTLFLKDTIVFSPQDGHPGRGWVSYKAFQEEKPVLDGGADLSGWKRVESSSLAFPENVRPHLWTTRIPEDAPAPLALFRGGQRLPRARSASIKTENAYDDPRSDASLIYYPKGTMRDWQNLEDVEVIVRPKYQWTMNILPLAEINEKDRIARTSLPATYPIARLRFVHHDPPNLWVENVPEALNKPGEWIYVSSERRIYLWPLSDKPDDALSIPMLKEFIRIDGRNGVPVRRLCFEGLTFTHGQRDTVTPDDAGLQHDWDWYDKGNALLRFRGAEHCKVQRCRFVNSAGGAIRADLQSKNISILQNEIAYMGGSGILIAGYGPGGGDLSSRNNIIANHVHHIGQDYWCAPGIYLWQSAANRVAHNVVHHTPFIAIGIGGVMPGNFYPSRAVLRELGLTIQWENLPFGPSEVTWPQIEPFIYSRDNLVENNEIHHVQEVLGDGNAIYIRMSRRGQIIRRNYIHDVIGHEIAGAIRADDHQHGCLISENLIVRCVASGIITKAANRIENNVIADMLEAGDPRNTYNMPLEGYIKLRPGSKWSSDGRAPLNKAIIERNIYYHTGDEPASFYDDFKKHDPEVDILNTMANKNIFYDSKHPELAINRLKNLRQGGIEPDSAAVNPELLDPKGNNYGLTANSPARKMGILSLNKNLVGPDKEQYTNLPE